MLFFSETSVAQSSTRLMNTSYTPAMANTSSVEFTAVSGPFCQEVNILDHTV